MDKLVYVAMTGARENMTAQTVRANNLANVSTVGFKADMEQARAMQVFGDGFESRAYALAENPATDVSEGSLIATGRNLDIALQGGAWMAVQSPDGVERYTRDGRLNVSPTGELVTATGLPVLGADGAGIFVPDASNVAINADGGVNVLGDEDAIVGQIKMVTDAQGELFKGTDGLFRRENDEPLVLDIDQRLTSGFLESSNVNAVAELTGMIELTKQFEVQLKMMKTAEKNSEKAATILKLS